MPKSKGDLLRAKIEEAVGPKVGEGHDEDEDDFTRAVVEEEDSDDELTQVDLAPRKSWLA